ncbi:MAG: hypothetical protein PWP37_75 [Thermotogota bacterium]|nr:hypothetical protein [Thermotogota bacterium]MDK2863883.1 hypothetical protein [Thermotogota bacterium]HCZ06522.1 nucleotidyltransferase [Thermotogota bacterium]
MKVLGVVVEYNPFHNGHLYHLTEAKSICDADFTVAVMSGNFTQRGEPAIVDKFARTEIALRCGVDLVLELPCVYAVQDAGGFAFGAISSLAATRVVTDIAFGSESADLEALEKIASILVEQPPSYLRFLHEELKKGHSFPNARRIALMRYVAYEKLFDPSTLKITKRSNDILGLEYIVNAKKLGLKTTFHVIKRIGSDYRDENFKGTFSSASAIRRKIKEGDFESAKKALPDESYSIIMREMDAGRGPVFYEDMEKLILGTFRTMTRDELNEFAGFNEGLDQRFVYYAVRSGTVQEFLESVKAKRFTFSRLRRLSVYPILKMRKKLVEESNEKGPQYLRVLGFNEKGRQLLQLIKRLAPIPIVTNASNYLNISKKATKKERYEHFEPDLFKDQFELDIRATNVHSIFFTNSEERSYERDMRLGPVIIVSKPWNRHN